MRAMSTKKRSTYPRLIFNWCGSSDTAYVKLFLATTPGVCKREDSLDRVCDFMVKNEFQFGSNYENFDQDETVADTIARSKARNQYKQRGRGRGGFRGSYAPYHRGGNR